MNLELRVVIRHLGLLLLVISAMIAAVALFALYERAVGDASNSADLVALTCAALIGALVGGALFLAGRPMKELIGQREAMVLVATGWLLGAALSAAPFRIWASLRPDAETAPHSFDCWVDGYFEAMSGLTTTGSTVITSLATMPRSLLLWRALTHWLGGLGIVVLFVAVLPLLGGGSRRLYCIEAPGPSPKGVKPRIQDTARTLWLIYCGLTVAEIIALRLCGMSWFESTCHTFATLATGGFGTRDASVAAYSSVGIYIVIIVFMILAGVNFGLYHQLLQKQWRNVRNDPELRAYLAIIALATLVVLLAVGIEAHPGGRMGTLNEADSFGSAFLHAVFQVISIQTTTGFCSADFDQWAFAAKATLVVLMFVGASAGSTGGGIKVVRILIVAKVMYAELEHFFRPRVIRPVKIGNAMVDADMKINTLVYILGIGGLFALGTVLLMLFEGGQHVDITTAATASAATLNNIGPGLGLVGATHNYAWFSGPSKIVMSMLMLVGRLEMFTILALLSPRFWKP